MTRKSKRVTTSGRWGSHPRVRPPAASGLAQRPREVAQLKRPAPGSDLQPGRHLFPGATIKWRTSPPRAPRARSRLDLSADRPPRSVGPGS